MLRSFRLLLTAFALAAPLALTGLSGTAEARAPRGQAVESGTQAQPAAARQHTRRHSARSATRQRQHASAGKRAQRQHAARARRAAARAAG